MAAYSRDLRQRVVRAYDSGMPVAAVAQRFEVSVAWVYRLVQRRRVTGSIEPRKQIKFRSRALSAAEEARLVFLIAAIFWWAVRSGQFDDLEGPAHRILLDDETPRRKTRIEPSKTEQ